MAIAVSLINMKGGVGKTTIAAQLAHSARRDGHRVLAVDLDPQSNLSQALMGPRRYVRHLTDERPTIIQVFDDYVPSQRNSGSPRPLDVHNVVLHLSGEQQSPLDLIPSRLELSRTLKNPTGKERRLAKCIAQVSGQYDLILIDCAPTESILTDAAYFASRHVVVRIKPEFMATIGLPLLARSIRDFRLENDDHTIDIAGLCFVESSYYATGPEAETSKQDVTNVAAQHGWRVFDTRIRHSASYPRASREATSLWGTPDVRWWVCEEFDRFKDEVFRSVGLA